MITGINVRGSRLVVLFAMLAVAGAVAVAGCAQPTTRSQQRQRSPVMESPASGGAEGFVVVPLGGVPVQVHFETNPVAPSINAGGRVTFGPSTDVTQVDIDYLLFGDVKLDATSDTVVPVPADAASVWFRVKAASGSGFGSIWVIAKRGSKAGVGILNVVPASK
jgi:hypothetical protein